jgi:DNA-binding response OmpR family regulator
MATSGVASILYVEDELAVARALRRGLEKHGFAVELAKDSRECGARVAARTFEAFLLDRMLPGDDGLQICSDLRRMGIRVPIFIVTADRSRSKEIEAFGIGADDYIVKPVDCGALAARLTAACRNAQLRRPLQRVGAITIDPDARVAYLHDRRLDLTNLEYKLLAALAERAGQTVSRRDLAMRLWNPGKSRLDEALDVQVNRLRLKLREGVRQLFTDRGSGYRLHSCATPAMACSEAYKK